MRVISLSQNRVALIDDADYPLISRHRWCARQADKIWYARTTVGQIEMHRLLLGFPSVVIDHRNRNGLDNRRRNLRLAGKSFNGANRGKNRNNQSGFKGVSWDEARGCWKAVIKVRWEQVFLGRYQHKEEAAIAYAFAALLYFGEFARI